MIRRAILPPLVAAAALAVALLAAGCASSGAAAGRAGSEGVGPGWSRRAFAVRDHGRLLLSIPPGWTVTEQEGRPGEASDGGILLTGPGDEFRAVLSPLWNPGEPEGPEARVDTAQLFAEIARRKALAGSVERELTLERVEGPGVRGYWFSATDRELVGREPGPDEWRHMLRGAAAVGPVILAFTLLDNGPGPQRSQLLEVVRSARHVPDGGDDADAVGDVEAVPDARTVPLRVAWPGKSWAVLVDLPDFRVGVRRGAPSMAPAVLAVNPASGIVATVILREAGPARDAAGCREQALAAVTRGIPRVSGMVLGDGIPARAAYVVTSADGIRQTHLHGFLARDGVCANVHVSKVAPSPEDQARLEAILSSVRFGEDL